MTFAVIGAGPTGVELAGTLAEIARHTLVNDFRHIDPRKARVLLIEAGPRVLATFTEDLSGKALARGALRDRMGLPERSGPLAVAVTRLAEQKGIDLILPLLPELDELGAQLAILGAGEARLGAALRDAAAAHPTALAFVEGYDEALAHLLIAGGDLLLMPSRFEPCGLTQMQAMRYGTLPVVTDVGGLHDTVSDLDEDPERGTGWRAATPTAEAVRDAFARAVRGWANVAVREAAQRRGMSTDWSWTGPAASYAELYRRLSGA